MIFRLFLSKYDSEEELRQKEKRARALERKDWSHFVEIEADTIETAVSVFLNDFFEDLADNIDGPLFIAQVLENGRIQVTL